MFVFCHIQNNYISSNQQTDKELAHTKPNKQIIMFISLSLSFCLFFFLSSVKMYCLNSNQVKNIMGQRIRIFQAYSPNIFFFLHIKAAHK